MNIEWRTAPTIAAVMIKGIEKNETMEKKKTKSWFEIENSKTKYNKTELHLEN